MTNEITELFSLPVFGSDVDWHGVVQAQYCPFIAKKCIKIRKSQPDVAIGTCSVGYSKRTEQPVVICPHRFLAQSQIFLDCIHLLTLHEPGNQIHTVAEIEIPGGSVDYFLVSVQNNRVVDFVGIEIQTLDTTGTVWPARQRFLQNQQVIDQDEVIDNKSYGINWKMTAKTTLVQLHHKITTFEALGKHLVLVVQDVFMAYMQNEFDFAHITSAKIGHAMHFHPYHFYRQNNDYQMQLSTRQSTDAEGIARALGLQSEAKVELSALIAKLESKLSANTILQI